ncbi:MAG: cytochrome c oxidase subunit I [Chloroflexi bacterium]|nr:cytochrome c oxidase subunit I [Chloroflexota bacterium]
MYGALEPASPLPRLDHPEGLWSWVATVDHKQIGILYLLTVLLFLVVGGLEAMLLRLQLAVPRNGMLGPDVYNATFTLHGVTMIFLVIMPAGIGLGNYFVPLMIGARDMAFPRLNALSYWLYLFGGLLLYYSLLDGGAPAAGWTAYPPLSLRPFSSGAGMDHWSLGLLVAGISSIAAAVNLIITIAVMRAPGMTWTRLPIFAWTILITAFLIIWGMPTLTAAAAMLVLDRGFGAHFFGPRFGGLPVMYQHLFWWLGHPEVYIMALPVFGIISEVIPVFARKPIFGYFAIVLSTVLIGLYSLLVWAHHMFTVGLTPLESGFFSGASFLIAIPTGIKVLSWLATLWGGAIRFTTAMLFALGFLVNFTIGGVTGVAVAVVPFDWQVHDTYYVVAHLHYVLVGGSLLGLFAGAYYWFPKITGRLLSERLGRWHFWLAVIGITLTFMPMHLLGLWGMARRIYTYPEGPWIPEINLIVTIGALVQAAAMLVFFTNIAMSLRNGKRAGGDPWDGFTLEWSTPSPPPGENFEELPTVRGRRPWWDAKQGGTPGDRHGEGRS